MGLIKKFLSGIRRRKRVIKLSEGRKKQWDESIARLNPLTDQRPVPRYLAHAASRVKDLPGHIISHYGTKLSRNHSTYLPSHQTGGHPMVILGSGQGTMGRKKLRRSEQLSLYRHEIGHMEANIPSPIRTNRFGKPILERADTRRLLQAEYGRRWRKAKKGPSDFWALRRTSKRYEMLAWKNAIKNSTRGDINTTVMRRGVTHAFAGDKAGKDKAIRTLARYQRMVKHARRIKS